jgi:formylglycine-generating enzyme required for sulfatase activity
LPTHAEWEYAARAGTRTAFYSGNISEGHAPGTCEGEAALDGVAWYCANSEGSTHPVGLKQPNAFGLYDMLGNAGEWHHTKSPVPRPEGAVTDPYGGTPAADLRQLSSCVFTVWPTGCRVAFRHDATAKARGPGVGLRLARTL